jgi:hypothetical protein
MKDDRWMKYRQLIIERLFNEALVEAKRVAPAAPDGFDRDFYIEHMVQNHVEEELRKVP